MNADKLNKSTNLPIACINAFFGCIARTIKMYLMSCNDRMYVL